MPLIPTGNEIDVEVTGDIDDLPDDLLAAFRRARSDTAETADDEPWH